MDILSMLFKLIVKINPDTEPNSVITESSEKNQRPVELQCIVCTGTFNINTQHNCLLRETNQDFSIKYNVR